MSRRPWSGLRHRGSHVDDTPAYSDEVRALLAAPDPGADVSDPTPWPEVSGSEKPVLLVPAADYHLEELVPLAEELNNRGVPCAFAVGRSPWERTRRGLASYPDLELHWLPDPDEVARDVRLVVTLKDTGSMTDWVTQVRAKGIPVIGKVEGAQDFWDADTPEKRRPYRNLDLVLCQGAFDAEALIDVGTATVGSSRLERMWNGPPAKEPDEPLALINLNFVYGVRTADRKLWLDMATEACRQTGIEFLVSLHPAEKTPSSGPRMTMAPALTLLPHASVLISRFSTLPIEAIACRIPFVYHNPHGELVKIFQGSHGAFETSASAQELALHLLDVNQESATALNRRQRFSAWFKHYVSIDESSSSAERTAIALRKFV